MNHNPNFLERLKKNFIYNLSVGMNSRQFCIFLGFVSGFLSSTLVINLLVCEFYETQNTSTYGLESTTISPVWPTRSSFTPCQYYDEFCLNEGDYFLPPGVNIAACK